MSFFTSIHDVKHLAASTVWDADNKCAPHLTLNFEGRVFEDHGAVTFYIADTILNARLIEVINRTVAERKAELSAERQEAARNAQVAEPLRSIINSFSAGVDR